MLHPSRPARAFACAAAALLLSAPALSSAAAPLVLDDFSTAASQPDLLTDTQNFVTTDTGTFAGQPGQLRSGYYYHYWPTVTTATTSTATLGVGGVSVGAAPGEIGELALGYGNYALGGGSNGQPLALDLSHYDDFQVTFSGLSGPINLLVGFYTSVPGSSGDYYWNGEVNFVPTPAGGPATVDILFKGRDQYQSGSPPVFSDPAGYNFASVDGVVFIVDRAAQSDGNSYRITNLSFTTAPVPEPSQWAMFLAAGAVFGLLMHKRRI